MINFQGLVVDEGHSVIKDLLIGFADQGALVDLLYDMRDRLPSARRERWAKQIVQGLSEIHEAGFVQGDFTLSTIPKNYSPKNWDPTEEPLWLLGNVFEANSLGKWIYDWTVSRRGPKTQSNSKATRSPTHHANDSKMSLKKFMKQMVKSRIGLPGFLNGTRVSAIADTGSEQNILSAKYVQDLALDVQHSLQAFILGNSDNVQSSGTVSLPWAFEDTPHKIYNILFHVLPGCIHDVILGDQFLTRTETMSTQRHRLRKCNFLASKAVSFNLIGSPRRRMAGSMGKVPVLALPDFGSEENIVSEEWARRNGYHIKSGRKHRTWIRFANGSMEETVGQIEAPWTFGNGQHGQCKYLTFHVLASCASDVVLGAELLYKTNAFNTYGDSIIVKSSTSDFWELQPFDFVVNKKVNKILRQLASKESKGPT